MSASCGSCGTQTRSDNLVKLGLNPSAGWDHVVALAGNPNTGKSTVFNALTGLRQHTGNWPGKTVVRAEGVFLHDDARIKLVDLPGTYSLMAGSPDEEVARDFILFGQPDVTVVVVDATRLERNLNLVLQILEMTDRVVVCLNLMDEARRRGVAVDPKRLEAQLGVPVVPTVARRKEGIDPLMDAVLTVARGERITTPRRLGTYPPGLTEAMDELVPALRDAFPSLDNAAWVALRLLSGDERVMEAVRTGELDASEPEEEVHLAAAVGAGGTLAGPRAAISGVARGTISSGARGDFSTGARGDFSSGARGDFSTGSPGDLSSGAPRDLSAGGPVHPAGAAVVERAARLRWHLPQDVHDRLMETIYGEAHAIAESSTARGLDKARFDFDRILDRLVTSKWTGFPLMLVLLTVVFWLTIAGANVPSAMLADLLIGTVHPLLHAAGTWAGFPGWLSGFLFDGVYLATAWVVSVMLPPMAIFFPLFTLLEDFGYLPRVAFNMDALFRKAGAHGKQALTMCMGFGCNAAGVVSTRVIDSPRERLIAIITNNFSLCNGRWPTQILIASIFIGALAPAHLAGLVSAGAVVAVVLIGVLMMFLSSWALSNTVLKGEASTFSLELPPYRPPRVLQTLYTSLIDRTLIILWRAVIFAVPAGAAIWLISNVSVGDASVAEHLVSWLNPLGFVIGMNGVILLAYVVAIPANEIVIPTVLMLTALTATGFQGTGAGPGVMFELESLDAVRALLEAGGWTLLTAVSLMLFSLLHNPCSTTIYTIWKETKSAKWTTVATVLPLAMGFVVCLVLAQVWRAVG